MEGGEATSDGEPSVDKEEVRQRRLAYFKTGSSENTPVLEICGKVTSGNLAVRKRISESIPLMKEKTTVSAKTSEFHLKEESIKPVSRVTESRQTEKYISLSSSRPSLNCLKGSHSLSTDPAIEKWKSRISGTSDGLSNLPAKLPFATSDMNMTPTVSDTAPQFSNHHTSDGDRQRWASIPGMRAQGSESGYSRPVIKSGDREVESLFSTRKSSSPSQIPALSLKESIDIDSMSVFKSKADFDELGLSTHRPESSSSTKDFRDKPHQIWQRSVSSESLLLCSKAEEIRSLLGEEKYREFVEKSERELHQLHMLVDSPATFMNRSTEQKSSDHMSREDRPTSRNVPTPPPQLPSPQPAGPSKVGSTPRRRLRSSSPHLVSKKLQDIARTKEVQEAGLSRNYEQTVISHNITFSTDEIYRQAYGRDGGELSKSSSTLGSSYQDSNFWSSMTPGQMTGGMSPTSPQAAPIFQPHFMSRTTGGSMRPPLSQSMPVGSMGENIFYPHAAGVSMVGTGTGQYAYFRPPSVFMPMSRGTSPQSPDAFFYHMYPPSQSMPGFHAPPSSHMQASPGLTWQYAHPSMGQEFQAQQEPLQWNQFDPRFQQNLFYGSEGPLQTPTPPPAHSHPHQLPTKIVGKGVVGGGDREKKSSSQWKNRSWDEHANTLPQYHEQQRHDQVKSANKLNSSQASEEFSPSASAIEHYFASLGMGPTPNYPQPSYHPYHHHPPPPSYHQPLPSSMQMMKPSRPARAENQRNPSVSGSQDFEDMTTVTRTSWATGTSLHAGGITDRLEELGVDPLVVHSIQKRSADVVITDEETLEAMRTLVRICPECQSVNKEYMTWCLQCGGVLIGIDPIPAKDIKKKARDKRGADSKLRKASSQGSLDESISSSVAAGEAKVSGSQEIPRVERTVPVEVRHHAFSQDRSSINARSVEGQSYHNQTPVLEFEEIIEDEIIYSARKEPSNLDEIPEQVSQLTESNNDVSPKGRVGSKESPESGRGASASSSPCHHNVLLEDAEEPSQKTVEMSDKDSGRPSSGEGAESQKPQGSLQLVPENGPRRSEKEINEICEVISDPIIRGFIKNYLQKKPQDVVTGPSQPLPNKQRDFSHRNDLERESSDSIKAAKKQVPKAFSLDLETGDVNSITASSSKPSTTTKKEDTPKRKKSVKKGHEAIDVEIFAIEDAKILRSSRSGASMVPKLNLVHSSDEEDDSSEKTASLNGAAVSSIASSPREDSVPVKYSTEIQFLVGDLQEENNNQAPNFSHSPDPSFSQPNPQLANNNFLYLKEQVETQEKKCAAHGKKMASQSRTQPKPSSTTSKVRASIEAQAPSRHWMRSSIAWSSYHPRELRTRSSLSMQSMARGARAGSFRAVRSTDSLDSSPAPPREVPPGLRPRPASADQNNSRGARGSCRRPSSAGRGQQRPHSAGFYSSSPMLQQQLFEGSGSGTAGDEQSSSGSNSQADSPRFQDSEKDIEGRPIHRLAVQEDTLPLIPAGPSTALKIYDRCFEQTPRDDGEQDSKWLFLPDELWLHVFTYLPQLALFHILLTCKQLYRIAMDPQLWKWVTVRKKSVKNEWLGEIGRRHPVSLALVQCYGNQLSENILRELFKEVAPKLKELNFSRCSKGKLIGDEILLHASTYCRHLTHVDASWCHVTDVGLIALASCCHRLESLCLNGCQQITDESLKTVMEKHGASLRVLELFGCFSLSPASFVSMAALCTFLVTLNIGQCYKITDADMVKLTGSLSHVETLDLRGCKKLGDTSIRKIVRNCQRLRHLVLANCPQLSNSAIVEIATYSKDIRSLDICGCSRISDTSIQTLVKNCFRLTAIDISSTSCTHKSVLMLADSSHFLEIAKFNFLADIHEQSLARLIKNCKRLNTVHLYGCNVRDVSLLKRYNRFLNIEL